MHRLAALVLAALVLVPAGLAARPAVPGNRLEPQSLSVSPPWGLIAGWNLSRPWSSTTTDGSAVQQRGLENELVREINDIRRSRELKPFVFSSKLAAAAAQHTREMGADGYFDHDSFDSTPFWKRVERWYPSRGFRSWSVGENLMYSSPDLTADDGVNLWMKSPPHRANLLNRSWREIGLSAIHFDTAPGEYENAPVTIVTADFGARR